MEERRIFFIGDIVGEIGLAVLESELEGLKQSLKIDIVIANGENAADGFGLTDLCADRIFAAGVDIITGGNHTWEKRAFWPRLDSDGRLLRPANMPNGAVGRGWVSIEKEGMQYCIINLMGREFMSPLDCPFKALDHILSELGPCAPHRAVVVDFHAESSQEKEALALSAVGQISALVGTHTHVATSDSRLLDGKTAYQTDLGMTGAIDSIIGMEKAPCIQRMMTQVSERMTCARGQGAISGALVTVDATSGWASKILRIKRFSAG